MNEKQPVVIVTILDELQKQRQKNICNKDILLPMLIVRFLRCRQTLNLILKNLVYGRCMKLEKIDECLINATGDEYRQVWFMLKWLNGYLRPGFH